MKHEPRTEGQRQLLAVDAPHSAVAAKVGSTKQAVSYWRRGEKKPGAAAQAHLLDAYGIPPAAWDQAAETDALGPSAIDVDQRLSTPDHTDELIREFRRLRSSTKLAPSVRARIISDEAKLVVQKEKREERREEKIQLLEDRIVREHPAWRRIEDAIIEWAKAQGPELARSLADTLAELETS